MRFQAFYIALEKRVGEELKPIVRRLSKGKRLEGNGKGVDDAILYLEVHGLVTANGGSMPEEPDTLSGMTLREFYERITWKKT